ncbi:MAG: ferritin-like domain-containing protein [Alphaproteobacteria bacterium]|nr:MAG: ferritin-like domain-containing protein [Alphaproteobacteria bacterium]
MAKIGVHNRLTAEHAGEKSGIYPLIAAKVRRESAAAFDDDVLWPAQWWGLDRSRVFMKAAPEVQEAALAACARGLLNEAYFIEKSGLAYSAKMVLLAPSTDVAQLYALIGADEARHLAWIEPFVSADDKTRPRGPFLAFLSSLIEACKPELLVYLVQVILEGWGIDHYRRLADGCSHPGLAAIFRNILKDEAMHHRSGILQHDAKILRGKNRAAVAVALETYADMVRVGPQSALAAVDAVCGGLAEEELADVMTALGHETETPRKLALLKELMLQPGTEAVVEKIDFTPLSVPEAVAFYQGHSAANGPADSLSSAPNP